MPATLTCSSTTTVLRFVMFNICLPLPPNNNCLPASCFFLEPSCSWLAFHFTLGVPPPLVTQVFPLLGHPSCPPSFPHPSLTSRWNPSGSRRLFPHLPTPPIPGKGGSVNFIMPGRRTAHIESTNAALNSLPGTWAKWHFLPGAEHLPRMCRLHASFPLAVL